MSNELTTSTFWDSMYVSKPRPRVGWLRRCVRRKFDVLLRSLLDLAGQQAADVMELGCAPGRMLERMHLVRPKIHLHGIDYSKVGIRIAKEYLRDVNIEARIHEGDFQTTKVPYQCDLVVSFGLIEHFFDPVPIVCDHIRFGKPGGYVAVTVPNFATPINKQLLRWFNSPAVNAHFFEIMNPEAIKRTLTVAGLQDVRVGAVDGPRVFPRTVPNHRLAHIYESLAVAWNFTSTLSPVNWPWQYTFWGAGRIPEE